MVSYKVIEAKVIKFLKEEKRLVIAGGFLLGVFLLNQLMFSGQEITSEDCVAGQCAAQEAEGPQLTKENNIFYQDDILTDVPSGYYRLTFRAKSDRKENISVKLNAYTEKNEKIKTVSLEESDRSKNYEIFFFLPEGFDNLLFEKEDPESEGNIFLKNIGISKLNVDSEEEFAAMRETIIGETKMKLFGPAQTKFAADEFSLLQEPKTILGQTFKAESDYISGISFNIDIIKGGAVKDKNFRLSLQEMRCGGVDCKLVGSEIAWKTFSISDALGRYRQEDGTFLFPLYANVEKGKSYFVGIDNSDVEVSQSHYLELKGSKSDDAYAGGSAAFKVKKDVYKIAGDLAFAVRTADFDIQDGVRILNGARIESLGKGQGRFTYATKGEFADALDLWKASAGTNFDSSRKVIVGSVEEDAILAYEVNTIFPMRKIHFSAEQAKSSWKKVKVEYSFDQEKWITAPFSENADQEGLVVETIDGQDGEAEDGDVAEEEGVIEEEVQSEKDMLQKFDFDVMAPRDAKTVYFRITPDMTDTSRTRYFAIKNLKIEADLIVK